MPPDVTPSDSFGQGASIVAPLPDCARMLRSKIAAEIDRLRVDLDDLGVQLCMDEATMLRCMSQLQRLDEMGQRCLWLAKLIRSDTPEQVIPDITLQSLMERMLDGDEAE